MTLPKFINSPYRSFYLFQCSRFRVNDKAPYHDILRDKWMGLDGLDGLVILNNLIYHNTMWYLESACKGNTKS